MFPALSSIGGMLGSGGGGGGGVLGPKPGSSDKSSAEGTFTGGGLSITRSDDTIKIVLLVIGAIFVLSILRKK